MIDDPELPAVGVIPLDTRTARWCVWAPDAGRVDLVLDPGAAESRVAMGPTGRGHHACETPLPALGRRYGYSLDGGPTLPDPLSRWQPDGIDAPSAVFFPKIATWNEGTWRGIDRKSLVFYELHVGTFTPEGTFDAVLPRVPELLDLGVTAIELMPVAQFPGVRNWGYDGVFPFAPQSSYGGPQGLHRLIEGCHALGMAVFVDVVYNHFGPDGNVFPIYGPYLTDKVRTAWGPAVNFDGRGCDPVRAMVLDNVRMWVRDYHVDGLRLDAADQLYDRSPRHILAEVADLAHREAERRGRPVHLFAETDQNDAPRYLRSADRGGYALDGHWNDDFHHAAHACLTGESDGYYVDFRDGARALAKVYEKVFFNDGIWSPFRGRRHGTSATEFPGDRFVAFVQNHDQVGNRLRSDRNASILSPAAARLAAGILLLAPRLPLLFMGEEYGETNPFPYFCDFKSRDLVEAVRSGRKAEFAHFGWKEEPPDPVAPATRDSAVLSWRWDDPTRAGLRRLYRDLLRLRRTSPALRDFRHARTRLLDGDVLEAIRGGGPDSPELRVLFNLSGKEQPLPTDLAAEAPSFRSEVADYGASRTPEAAGRLQPYEFAIFG